MTQVFLSHSTKDADFAQQIADDLRAAGVPVWKAPESIRPGEGWVEALEYGLTTSTHMLLLMSPAAVASKWVNWEFDIAMMLHTRGQIVILPVDYLPCDPPLRWQRFQSVSGIVGDYHPTLFGLLKQFRVEQPQKPPLPAELGTTIHIHVGGDVSGVMNVAGRDVTYAMRPEEPPPVPDEDIVPEVQVTTLEQGAIDPVVVYQQAAEAQAAGEFENALRLLNKLRQDAPDFVPDYVAIQAADVERLVEYRRVYGQISGLAGSDHTLSAARQLWLMLGENYPDVSHDPEDLVEQLGYRINDILPQPSKWVEIPEGQVTLEGQYNHYIPQGQSKTFTVMRFMIGKYPVTNAQFQVFVEAEDGYRDARWWDYSDEAKKSRDRRSQPDKPAWDGPPDHPRVNVTWFEAVAFCRWLSGKVGSHVRLPTEQEWQRAAQGDDGREYPWGNEAPNARLANFSGQVGQTTPVGSYPEGASPYGVLDMAGNVWEWCLTDFHTGLHDISRAADMCTLRGGSWRSRVSEIRAVHPDSFLPSIGAYDYGFRCALSP